MKKYELHIIGNPNLFLDYNVFNPPALVVEGKILVEGYVPTHEEMIGILSPIINH